MHYKQLLAIIQNKYLRRNFTILSLKVPVKVLLNFFALILLTRMVSPEEYGKIVLIAYVLGSLNFFGISGMNAIIVRNLSKGNDIFFYESLKATIKWTLLFIPVSIVIGIYFINNNNSFLGISLIILSLFKFFNLICSRYISILQGKKAFGTESIFSLLMSLDGFFALAILFYFDNLMYYVVALHAFDSLLIGCFFYYSTKKLNKENIRKEIDIESEISTGFNYSKLGLISQFMLYMDGLVIGFFGGFVALAGYSIARRIFDAFGDLIKNLTTVPSVKLAELNSQNYKANLTSYIGIVIISSAALTFFLYLLVPYFLEFIFPDFEESVALFQILSLSFLFLPMIRLTSDFFSYTRDVSTLFYSIVSSNIVTLILYISLYNIYGAIGIAYAVVLSTFYGFMFELLIFHGILKLPDLKKYGFLEND